MNLPANLPSIAKAKLPVAYEQAKGALAQCERIDECKDWADKAEAMASYAKQAQDDGLRKMADRIQARAIRRCGELLREIDASRGGRPKQGSAPSPVSRKAAARDAGLSERQHKTALRVARVPETEFEAAVESDAPPTVTQLADRGKLKPSAPIFDLEGRDPAAFQVATAAMGWIEDAAAFCAVNDPGRVVSGFTPRELKRAGKVLMRVRDVQAWLTKFERRLAKESA